MVAYSCGIDQNLLLQKTKLQLKKLGQMDENTAMYIRQSLKNSFQSQKAIHWTQRMNFSCSEKLNSHAISLTFNIRSKHRLNK